MLKSRIIYVILLLSAIGFYLFFGKYIGFVGLVFVLSMPLFLYAIMLITSRKIKIRFRDCKTIIQKQSTGQIEIDVDNESIFHISSAKLTVISENLFSNEKSKEIIVLPINANQVTTIKTELFSKYCGDARITITSIRFYDFLSITSHTKKLNESLKITVLPNVYDINNKANVLVVQDDESHNYSTTKSGDDASQVFDYHEYHEGDKVKNIQWKLSTKLDKIMVKELSLPVSSTVCIAFEFGACIDKATELLKIDAQIETVSSISSWLFSNGIPHEIEWYNPADTRGVNMKVSSAEDLLLAIENFYNAKPHFKNLLLDEIVNRTVKPKISHIIYVTNSLSNDTLKPLSNLKEIVETTVILLKNENDIISEEVKQALNVVQINLIEIDILTVEESLQEISI